MKLSSRIYCLLPVPLAAIVLTNGGVVAVTCQTNNTPPSYIYSKYAPCNNPQSENIYDFINSLRAEKYVCICGAWVVYCGGCCSANMQYIPIFIWLLVYEYICNFDVGIRRIIYIYFALYICYLYCALPQFCGDCHDGVLRSLLFQIYYILQIDELTLGAFVNAIMAFYFEITHIIG